MEMSRRKTVTVVICVYNRACQIGRCLRSVLSQTYPGLDIIIIDDGSSDGLGKALEEFSGEARVRVFYNTTNLGLMASRNRGRELSDSEIVAYLDSDCVAAPDWIEELVKPFAVSDDIVMTGGRVDDPDPENYWGLVMKGNNFISHDSGITRKIMGGNMAFRRDFLLENRFDETLKYGADETDLCMRATGLGKRIYYQDSSRVTHFHRNRPGTLIKHRFLIGVANCYVRLKNGVFPYVSIKSVCLTLALLCSMLSATGMIGLPTAVILWLMYVSRVFYENLRPGRKSMPEALISLPGKLLLTVAEDLGYLYGIYLIPHIKRGQVPSS
jgi:glycosyltransferase involved in cell wall biosynthesis